jgi:hypothetical protein
MDVEPQVREAPRRADLEGILRVARELRARQDLDPARARRRELLRRRLRVRPARIDRAGLREVALEVRRVDHHAAQDPRHAQPQDAPVVPGPALAPRLPAIHQLAALGVLVRQEHGLLRAHQVLLGCEELIVREQRRATEALGQ